MMPIASGVMACHMAGANSSTRMVAAIKELLSREYQVEKAGSSALKAGTMKENSSKNRLRVEDCFLLKISAISTRASGKETFPMVRAMKYGLNLDS